VAIRVYRFGVLHRGPLPDVAEEQARLARGLWNACVEIHKRRDAERRAIADGASETVAALVARKTALAEQDEALALSIRNARASSHDSPHAARMDASSAKAARTELRTARRAVAAALTAARQEQRGAISPLLHASSAAECEERKAARQHFCGRGLYWGTSNHVLQGFAVACKREAQVRTPEGRARLGVRPGDRLPEVRFHRADGSAAWTVQFVVATGDPVVTWADVTGPGAHALRITIPPDGATETITAKNGRQVTRRLRGSVRLQVRGERAKREDGQWVTLEPAWIELPVTIHRQPAPGSRVLGAQVTREMVAGTAEYALCVTVEEPDVFYMSRSGPAVAVDIGWRRRPDGRLRAAYWVGADGSEGEILVPVADASVPEVRPSGRHRGGDVEWQDARADEIEGQRDRNFNVARDALVKWLDANPALPEWLREVRDGHPARPRMNPDGTPTLDREGKQVMERAENGLRGWRSQGRLASVCIRWRSARFDDDADPYLALEAWRRQDRHLWEWAGHMRRQAQGRRTDAWRKVAHRMASRYAYIIVEDMRIPEVTRQPAPEDGPRSEGTPQRHAARIAAPGALRMAIEQAAAKLGATSRRADATNTTRRHHGCGHIVEQDYSADVMVYCPHCAVWYDQDRNAALNLLDAASGEPRDADQGGTRAPGGSKARGRFQRAKDKRQQEDRSQDAPDGVVAEGL